jgi:sulfite exporter TauE/SafE
MIWSALLLGLAGSLHCVAMCGPLMLAIPLPPGARWSAIWQTLLYQAGRIVTYAFLGWLFGVLGKGIAVAGFQQALSVVAGVAMIAAALFAFRWEQAALTAPGIRRLTEWVQRQIGKLLRRNPAGASLGVGLLNGLLPCGMVYAALAGAVSVGGPIQGSLFMTLFGLGTLPALFLFMLSGRRLGASLRARFRLVQPALLALTGLLLLSRGLHLDLALFESAVPPAPMDCY